nr:hypothetical protein [Tanacetum cinerariifolium]
MNSPTIRLPFGPSTPTPRGLTPSLSTSTTSSVFTGRALSSTSRTTGSNYRSSSHCLHICPTPQPINHTDFSHEIPPNIRTTLPDRPLSAGTSRPVGSTTTKGGFGRNISKKSLDMAIKHMDIRNGGPRLSGSTLFPQSIRSSNSRAPGRASSAPGSVVDGPISNGITSENGSYNNVYSWNRGLSAEDQSPHSSKLSSEVDIYESSRYDAILLKEDLKNTSWLHSADDKIDEGSFFDNG